MTPMLTDDSGGTAFMERVCYVGPMFLIVCDSPFSSRVVYVPGPISPPSTIANSGDESGLFSTMPHIQLSFNRRRF